MTAVAAEAPLLEVRGLRKVYGGFAAVNGVSFRVQPGSVHAVIGPNGAGKTTLFRLLTGEVKPTEGEIFLAGTPIGGRKQHVVARHGVSQTFQITSLFDRLTVRESLQVAMLAAARRSQRLVGGFRSAYRDAADQLLDRVGLAPYAEARSAMLSHGDQRVLEIALALATRPRLLLMDEPTSGMSPLETQRTVRLVAELVQQERLTVVLSEHDMDVVFGVSDHVTVMHQGQVIADGTPAQVRADARVAEVYLGEEA